MWVSSKVEIACITCDKKFKVKPSAISRGRKFCSRKCYGLWQSQYRLGEKSANYKKVTITCPVCGRAFKIAPSCLKKGRKYCSRQCYDYILLRKLEQDGLEQNLICLYITKKLSSSKIATIYDCNNKTITYWLHKFGIPLRTRSEICTLNNLAKGPEVRQKMSDKAKLRCQQPEVKAKFSQWAKRLWANPEKRAILRMKISQSLKGNKRRKGIPHSMETREKIATTIKERWKSPEYAKNVLASLQEEPNKSEKKLSRIIEENDFPFRYVGDGQVIIDGQIPDFIDTNGSNKLIELFGRPWHDPNHSKKIRVKENRTENNKLRFYASHSYDCLVIWDEELKDENHVVDRIKAFVARQHIDLYEQVLEAKAEPEPDKAF